MGKPKAPTPPDPVAISNAQSASNLNSAVGSQILNQTNQNTPYGSVNYSQTGNYNVGGVNVPQFTQNVTLSPAQQAILDKSQGLQSSALDTGGKAIQNVAGTIGQPFSLKGVPQLQQGKITSSFKNPAQQMSLDPNAMQDVFGTQRDQVQQALMSRFDEDWNKQMENSKGTMNAQGLQLGSEAYGDEMNIQNRARNDALMQSILGAGAEQQRMFEMGKGAGEFANNAAAQQFAQNQGQAAFGNAAANQAFTQSLASRQQGVNEKTLERSQPINEFATLFGLGSGVQTPTGANQTGVGVNPADILGANALQYQVLMNNYNSAMQNRNAAFGALGSAAGMAGAAMI